MIWEGDNAISIAYNTLSIAYPYKSTSEKSIRYERNICEVSETIETTTEDIQTWFGFAAADVSVHTMS